MDYLVLALGVAVLVLTIVEILWTALWVDGGAGPLSGRIAPWIWRTLRRFGGDRPRVLGLAGPLALTATLATWIGLLWTGWVITFTAGEPALVNTRAPGSADLAARFYFVGYTMFTMGNGDFYPPTDFWQVATGLTTASGMLFATMTVTYLLKVMGAVADKRTFAAGVTGFGRSSEALVRSGWDGEDFDGLHRPLHDLASQLDRLAEEHKAYPILHYYHPEQHTRSSAVAVAVLDDAATLMNEGVEDDTSPNPALLADVDAGVQSYLETLDAAFITPAATDPPAPDLEELRRAGIPTVDDAAFEDAVRARTDRRRNLLGTVRADAWPWLPVEDD